MEQTSEARCNEYRLEWISEGYPKVVQVDDSLNPKLRVTALKKFYNSGIRKKFGTNQECVVWRVALRAMSVSC